MNKKLREFLNWLAIGVGIFAIIILIYGIIKSFI